MRSLLHIVPFIALPAVPTNAFDTLIARGDGGTSRCLQMPLIALYPCKSLQLSLIAALIPAVPHRRQGYLTRAFRPYRGFFGKGCTGAGPCIRDSMYKRFESTWGGVTLPLHGRYKAVTLRSCNVDPCIRTRISRGFQNCAQIDLNQHARKTIRGKPQIALPSTSRVPSKIHGI